MDSVNRDYYDVMGVPRNADAMWIKQAYFSHAEKYRPENNAGNVLAAKDFALFEEAYATLGNPAKRAAYDLSLRSPPDAVASSAAAKVDASVRPAPSTGTRHRAETSAPNLSGKSGYVQQVLGRDEHVQYTARVSRAGYFSLYILCGPCLAVALGMFAMANIMEDMLFFSFQLLLSGLVIFGYGLVTLGWIFRARSTTELALTNRRLIAKFGVVSRTTVEIGFKKIESIRVKQGVFGRKFNYGDVIVTGSGATHAPIPNIDNPLEFRRAFDVAMEQFDQPEKNKNSP